LEAFAVKLNRGRSLLFTAAFLPLAVMTGDSAGDSLLLPASSSSSSSSASLSAAAAAAAAEEEEEVVGAGEV
jgi:hypothetical protein